MLGTTFSSLNENRPLVVALGAAFVVHVLIFIGLNLKPMSKAYIADQTTYRVSIHARAEVPTPSQAPNAASSVRKELPSEDPKSAKQLEAATTKNVEAAAHKQPKPEVKSVADTKLKPVIEKTETFASTKPVPQEEALNVAQAARKDRVEPEAAKSSPEPLPEEPHRNETKAPQDVAKKELPGPDVEDVRSPAFRIGSPNNPRPDYPGRASQRGWEGDVILGVHVEPDGSVSYVEILESSNVSALDFAAYSTVKNQWSFSPADEAEAHLKGYVTVPISFRLN